ncbi:MAG: S8 family serine peptidase [Aquabacterium sp.]|nr:S8 family serine peptidase [Aquabacterium sp.]
MSVVLNVARASLLGLVLILGGGSGQAEPVPSAPPRLAKGLIVKLKGVDGPAAARSIVRLQAAALSTESAQSVRTRMATVARRHGLSYLVQRPTAFAAQLVHSGKLEPLAQVQAQAARLRADPDVEWVIPNEVARPAGVVAQGFDDPAYPQQTWLHERETTLGGRQGVANIAAAWDAMVGKTISPVVVAVLDTGKLPAPDLDGRMAPGYDFVSEVDYSGDGDGVDSDPSDPGISLDKIANTALRSGCSEAPLQWHGLRIASMLGAQAGNALDGVGMLAPVPGPVVLPVRVAGMCGAELSDIVEGMLWAAGISYQGSPPRNLHPARVINLSFGGDGSCADSGTHDAAWLYRDTIKTLENKGVLVVASAGNGNPDTWLGMATPTRPASCPGVLAVTALNQQGYKANYANLVDGTRQHGLAVAGGDMVMTRDVDGHQVFTRVDDGILALADRGDGTGPLGIYEMQAGVGTSFAAPTAAGVAALMLALAPELTVAELRDALVTQVEPFATAFPSSLPICRHCTCTAQTCGLGVLDALRAVNWAAAHAGASAASGAATVASSDSSCFRPNRLGGGSSCDSGGSGGGGGGGASDTPSLLALAVACMASLMAPRRWWPFRGDRG